MILAVNPKNGNLKIQGDNGRVRWFSPYYFDLANGPAPTIVTMHIEILPVMDQDYVDRQWAGEDVVPDHYRAEATMELSDGMVRSCSFVEPGDYLTNYGTWIGSGESGGIIAYNRPSAIVISAVREDLIREALTYIDQKGELALCTDLERPVDDSDTSDDAEDDLVLDGPGVPSA
jgi:hypothetical protein